MRAKGEATVATFKRSASGRATLISSPHFSHQAQQEAFRYPHVALPERGKTAWSTSSKKA